MSGHSKWSTIKRQKGAADQKRGQTFTKIANTITLAAKLGGSGDPDSNPRLRLALEQARDANMPKDNIQRAIDRGLGKLPGQTLEEVVFEGFGPNKVALLIEGVTDNRLRTLQEIRSMIDRSGGALGSQGSTSYMFDKKGQIILTSPKSEEETILQLIDLGAQDVEQIGEVEDQKYLVYCSPTEVDKLSNLVTQAGFNAEERAIVFQANLKIEIKDLETARKIIELIDKIEEHDDIQKVYTNLDIPDNLVSQL